MVKWSVISWHHHFNACGNMKTFLQTPQLYRHFDISSKTLCEAVKRTKVRQLFTSGAAEQNKDTQFHIHPLMALPNLYYYCFCSKYICHMAYMFGRLLHSNVTAFNRFQCYFYYMQSAEHNGKYMEKVIWKGVKEIIERSELKEEQH